MHPRTPRIKKGGRKQAPVGGGGPRLFPLQHRGNAHAGGGSALCAVGRWADALGQGDGVQPCSQRGGAAGQGPQLRRLARGWRGCGRPGPRPRPRPGPCRGRGPVQQPGDGMLHARTSRMTHRLRRGLGVKPHVQQLPHDGGGGGPPRHGALGTAFTGPSPARPSAQMKSNYHAAHLESHCQGAPAAHRGAPLGRLTKQVDRSPPGRWNAMRSLLGGTVRDRCMQRAHEIFAGRAMAVGRLEGLCACGVALARRAPRSLGSGGLPCNPGPGRACPAPAPPRPTVHAARELESRELPYSTIRRQPMVVN